MCAVDPICRLLRQFGHDAGTTWEYVPRVRRVPLLLLESRRGLPGVVKTGVT